MKNSLNIQLSMELNVCQVGVNTMIAILSLELSSLPGDFNYLIQTNQVLKPGWGWPNFLKDSKPTWSEGLGDILVSCQSHPLSVTCRPPNKAVSMLIHEVLADVF